MNKSIIQEVLDNFLSGISPGTFIAGFLMAVIGIAFSALVGTTKRDVNSERTPFHFSWKFFFNDNSIRLVKSVLTALIAIFLSFRFAQEFIGQKFSMFYAFLVGFGLDYVVARWRQIKEKWGSKVKSDDIKMPILILFALSMFMQSCYTSKKAGQQVDKAISHYPVNTAKQLRKEWPCVTDSSKIDSTKFNASKLSFDSLMSAYYQLNLDNADLTSNNDQLVNSTIELQNILEKLRLDSAGKISADAIIDYIAEKDKTIASLKKKQDETNLFILKLQDAVSKIKPVEVPVKDMADVYIANAERDKANSEASKQQGAKNVWRIIALISLSINVLLILLFKLKNKQS